MGRDIVRCHCFSIKFEGNAFTMKRLKKKCTLMSLGWGDFSRSYSSTLGEMETFWNRNASSEAGPCPHWRCGHTYTEKMEERGDFKWPEAIWCWFEANGGSGSLSDIGPAQNYAPGEIIIFMFETHHDSGLSEGECEPRPNEQIRVQIGVTQPTCQAVFFLLSSSGPFPSAFFIPTKYWQKIFPSTYFLLTPNEKNCQES